MINWEIILEKTILIREFEKMIQTLYHTDCIQSPVHLSIGQELTAVLISQFYKEGDHLVGNYRSHALALSISDVFEPIILELLAKKDGVSGGKAGSMHLSVPNKNLMWTSAIVGTGVPIATGIAESLKRQTNNNVVLPWNGGAGNSKIVSIGQAGGRRGRASGLVLLWRTRN